MLAISSLLYIHVCIYVSLVSFVSHPPQRLLWTGPGHSCFLRGWWEGFRPGGCVAVWYGARRRSQSWIGRWRSRQWRKRSPLSDSCPERSCPRPPWQVERNKHWSFQVSLVKVVVAAEGAMQPKYPLILCYSISFRKRLSRHARRCSPKLHGPTIGSDKRRPTALFLIFSYI